MELQMPLSMPLFINSQAPQINRPRYLDFPSDPDVILSRVLLAVFTSFNRKNIRDNEIAIPCDDIWPGAKKQSRRWLSLRFNEFHDKFNNKLGKLYLINPEVSKIYGLPYKDHATALFTDIYLNSKKELVLRLNYTCLDMMKRIEYKNKIKGEFITVEADTAFRITSKTDLPTRFMFKIAEAQLHTNQIVFTIEEIIQFSGSALKPTKTIDGVNYYDYRLVNRLILKEAQDKLKGTPHEFSYEKYDRNIFGTKEVILFFKSNEEINQIHSKALSVFAFEEHLRSIKVTDHKIRMIKEDINEMRTEEGYVVVTLIMTYKYLLSKSGPHSPGGAFSKAYNDQWYLKDFETLKLENNLPALPSLPNFDSLKNGAREVKAIGKGPSDYDKLRSELYRYYKEVFGTNNEEVFDLILNSSFEQLLENLPQRTLKERAELLNNHAIQTFLTNHAIDCELALKSIGLSVVQIQRVVKNKPFLLEFMEVALRYNFLFKEDMRKILYESFMKRDNC